MDIKFHKHQVID
jgi:hypothetical protein